MIQSPYPLPDPIGQNGFSLPSFDNATQTEVSELHAWNGTLLSADGKENIIYSEGSSHFDIKFHFDVSHHNSIYISECAEFYGHISVTGSYNRIIFAGTYGHNSMSIHLNGTGSTCFIGKGCTFVDTTIFVTGNNIAVICGEDCMFSHATMVRTSDQHAIIDLATGTWVNESKSVLIEPHVWVGQESLVLKGSRIGKGSIIGARSTVTEAVPACSIAVGHPARSVRTGVSWLREDIPNQSNVQDLQKAFLHG